MLLLSSLATAGHRIVNAAAEVVGVTTGEALEAFGAYFAKHVEEEVGDIGLVQPSWLAMVETPLLC